MSGITIDNISHSKQSVKSRNKILMLGPLPPTVGGITTFIIGVAESDLNKKYKFILFGTERPTVGLGRDAEDYTLIARIGLMHLATSTVTTVSHIFKFPLVLILDRPDIVHINTASYWSFWENAVYNLISKMLNRKVIIHIHGGLFYKFYKNSNTFAKFLIRKVLDTSDKIIVLSSEWKSLLMNITSAQTNLGKRIIIIENFVNFSSFGHLVREDISEDKVNVLFVGVGAKTKGIYEVLKAIPLVVKEYEDIFFYFVACGNVEKYDIKANEETYVSHTRFLDYVSGNRKMKVFASADIFVLPSYSEGLPIAMLEAMAIGLPIIATPVGSIPEVIEEGKNGFLVEVGDYHALAEKILILAKDRKLRLKMATNNLEKIRKKYDRSVVMRKLGNLYAQILDN